MVFNIIIFLSFSRFFNGSLLFKYFLLFLLFLLLFMYSHLHFPATTFPYNSPSLPTHNPFPVWLCPCVLYTCSLTALSLFTPVFTLSPPLWLLSVCSLFPSLWFYFACLFVLLIRFH